MSGAGAQLRTGAPHIVRGGADVRWLERMPEPEAESSAADAHWLPASITLPASDIVASGMFRARTIEFTQTEERPVVSTEAVVREELVVRRTVDQRERVINETVRRTGVAIEETPSN